MAPADDRRDRHTGGRRANCRLVPDSLAHRRVFQMPEDGLCVRTPAIGELADVAGRARALPAIAWHLLLLRHLARTHGDAPAAAVLTARHLQLLRVASTRPLSPQPPVGEVLLAIARLGGHLRQNGEPGWLVLARGMQTLYAMEAGWHAAERARSDQSWIDRHPRLPARHDARRAVVQRPGAKAPAPCERRDLRPARQPHREHGDGVRYAQWLDSVPGPARRSAPREGGSLGG